MSTRRLSVGRNGCYVRTYVSLYLVVVAGPLCAVVARPGVTYGMVGGAHPTAGPAAGSLGAPRGVTHEDVATAVDRAVEFLWSYQENDGTWHQSEFDERYPMGLTALAAYTLRAAGAPPSDYRLQRAAAALLEHAEAGEATAVLTRSFRLRFWLATGPERFRQAIAADARFLKLQQGKDGGWGCGMPADAGDDDAPRSDSANTQRALAAVVDGTNAGVYVPPLLWRRVEQYWLAGQREDGGWGYSGGDMAASSAVPRDSYGTMTAAGLASLHAISDQLYLDAAAPFNGRFKARCGEDADETRPIRQAMARGWARWDAQFRADGVPGLDVQLPDDPREAYLTEYLAGAARIGLMSGRKRFGERDWASETAARLVRTQQPDGSWGGVPQTCYGVLALCAVRTPILVSKLRYGEGEAWNNDARDAANLTRWFSGQVGASYGWQVIDLPADAADLHNAPVLLITGHDAPTLDESAQSMLRDFVYAGGTILAVACCSRDSFVEGCRALFQEVFPRMTCGVLPGDHPVWSLHDAIKPADDCLGIEVGCRTGVFLLTNGACCAWQQNLIQREARHFALAGNILRYATFGQRIRGRLSAGQDAPSTGSQVPPAMPLRTVRIARLWHGGDWEADPDSLWHLSRALTRGVGLAIEEKPAVNATELPQTDIDALWVTGRTLGALAAAEQDELKRYLLSGGTLLASAYCGDREFDESFRILMLDLFGPSAWDAVAPDDPIMTGAVAPGLGSSLTRVALRPRFQGPPLARIDRPLLYGVRHEGRWIVIYSPVDINGGVVRHPCLDCVGYTTRDAEVIAGNLLLYVASNRPTTSGNE